MGDCPKFKCYFSNVGNCPCPSPSEMWKFTNFTFKRQKTESSLDHLSHANEATASTHQAEKEEESNT